MGQRKSALQPLSMAYGPDGLSPAQYKALKAKEAADKKASKNKKRGSVEDLTDWQKREAKKNPNQPGAGHVFVKIRGGEKGDRNDKTKFSILGKNGRRVVNKGKK